MGGLARRATYIKSVLTERPDAIVLESGNLAKLVVNPSPKAELETVADAFKLMHYNCVGVGALDLVFGDDYYKIMKARGIDVLQIDSQDRPDSKPYVIKTVNGVKVGIISFGATELESPLMILGRNEKPKPELTPERQKALREALRTKRMQIYSKVRKQVDVLILLDQADIASDKWLTDEAPRYGAPDIVIGSRMRLVGNSEKKIGSTLIVPTSVQGAAVGRIDVEIIGGEKKMKYLRMPIEPEIPEDAEIKKLSQAYDEAQRLAAQARLIRPTAAQTGQGVASSKDAYHPFQQCVACHVAEYRQWKETRHANALKTLENGKNLTSECLPCHSDMYRKTKTFITGGDEIGGVECGTCHVDVIPHDKDYVNTGNIAGIKNACGQCHTKERSPGFDVEKAYELVKHAKK